MLMVAFHHYAARTRAHREISAETYLNNAGQQLQQAFTQTHALLSYLQELTNQNPDIDQKTFQHMATLWLAQHEFPALRVMQLAKDGVVSHIHPLAGNEASKGHELLNDPARRKEARAAYFGFRTVTTPVVNLRQGGQGIIHRMSIRLPGSSEPWGLAIVVQDWERLRELSGFNHRESDFPLMIRGRSERSEPWSRAFVGDDAGFDDPHIRVQEINVPGGQWQLGVRISRLPTGFYLIPLLIAGNILVLIALFLLRDSFKEQDWPVPVVTAGTLLVVVAVFTSLFLMLHRAENRRYLAKWSTINQHRITAILNGHADFTRMLALQRSYGELSREVFRRKGREYVRENPELINFTWVDADHVIQEVSPRAGNEQILGLRIELEEPRRASRLARELGSGVYTRPFPAIQGGNSFEYWVPVFDRIQRFQGLVVAVYSMDKLMSRLQNEEEATDLNIALVDAQGNPLTGTYLPHARPDTSYSRRLVPPGHGLSLVLSNKTQGMDREVLVMAILGAGLVLLLFTFSYRLQRSRRLLSRQNQTLAHTKTRLEEEKERIHTTLNALHEGVITLNPQYGVEAVNTAALELLEQKEVLGRPIFQVMGFTNSQGGSLTPTLEAALGQARKYKDIQNAATQITAFRGDHIFHCTIHPLFRASLKTRGFVLIFHDVTQTLMREAQLEKKASRDPLTQCLNRQGFQGKYQALMTLGDPGDVHSLAYLDLDKFKIVNDTAGHAAGDRLLVELSRQIRHILRNSDLLVRMGGDEFVILLPGCRREDAQPLLEKVRQQIREFAFVHEDQVFYVGASLGGVEFTAASTIQSALEEADKACYQAKAKGRDCIVWAESRPCDVGVEYPE